MKNRFFFIAFFSLISQMSIGQNKDCEMTKSKSDKIFTVDKDDILCLAKNSKNLL